MLPVKLPYYPKVQATMSESLFGAKEISCPQIYNTPVPGHVICRVDVLDVLRDILDDSCFICRELLYAMISGSQGYYNYKELVDSYYKKYPSFRSLVNESYFYGDDSIPLHDRVLNPLIKEVNDWCSKAAILLSECGGKYLTVTHYYLYYSFKTVEQIPEIRGAVVIC